MPRTGGLTPRLQNAKADAYISGLTEGLRLAAGPDHTLAPGLAAQFERVPPALRRLLTSACNPCQQSMHSKWPRMH